MLNNKIQALNEYSAKYNLPSETQCKIKIFMQNQVKSEFNQKDWDNLYDNLPPSIRNDLIE